MELLKRYQKDGTRDSLAAVTVALRPLVASICRRYLRGEAEVEDAVQTVLGKLIRHADTLASGPVAWVTAAAHSTCVDIIRKVVRDRARLAGFAQSQRAVSNHPVEAPKFGSLDAALKELSENSRRLLEERFFSRTPLRVIAGREGTSVATVSRRVSSAVEELKSVMHAAPEIAALDTGYCEGGLRFASDWQALSAAPAPRVITRAGLNGFRKGWTRKIRVGAMVSHLGATTLSSQGFYFRIENQLAWAADVDDDGFEFVSIVEPGTSEIGHIERGVRDFDLTAGLIEATDLPGLKTLDVIVLPPVLGVKEEFLRAIVAAVESGVGLYKQWWMGSLEGRAETALVKRTMLAASVIGTYHAPEGHSFPLPATVHAKHDILSGLRVGEQLPIAGCGPFYRPVPSAKVLITKDALVSVPEVKELGWLRMPVLLAGDIGQGRVIVDHQGMPAMLTRHSALAGNFVTRVLEWLAHGKKE